VGVGGVVVVVMMMTYTKRTGEADAVHAMTAHKREYSSTHS
jgi:hypothetical protein